MTYLLDTHVFLWMLNTPATLPAGILKAIHSRGDEILVSIATPWEISIKCGIGKMNAADTLDHFDSLMAQGGYTLLETTTRQVIQSGLLPLHHKDPFDRLLAAQALDLRIPLLSRDSIFDRYGVRRIWN